MPSIFDKMFTMKSKHKSKIGLALGGGAARGWAHIGVIRALEEIGIKPDIVCGTSIGALVGAVYAAGELDKFEEWVLALKVSEIISYLDVSLSSGLLKGDRLMEFFRKDFNDYNIEDLDIPFAATATLLNSGAEKWLKEGSMLDAVRASIALPGLFTPVMHEGSVLIDGGLVNPVPVSLARALGADIVIAVDLNSDALNRHMNAPENTEAVINESNNWIDKLKDGISGLMPSADSSAPQLPSMIDVIAASINIMQVRISRSRMAGEPPDFILTPKLAEIGLLEFHRAKESIEEGKQAVERAKHSFPSQLN
jgi:NTE family protein